MQGVVDGAKRLHVELAEVVRAALQPRATASVQ
jgi:hypothetical protein